MFAGADNFERLHQWNNFKNLIKLVPFAIFSRNNFLLKIRKTRAFQICQKITDGKNLPKFIIFRTKNLNISSTEIRKNNE